MAKVQIVGPRLGIEFQGASSLPVSYAWLDEAGTPIPGDLPKLTPSRDQEAIVARARFTNGNDEAKVFSTPAGTGPTPVASVSINGFTVPANGTLDVSVTIAFDGSQAEGDITYIELSGESDA